VLASPPQPPSARSGSGRWLHQGGQDEGLRAQGRAGDRCGDDW